MTSTPRARDLLQLPVEAATAELAGYGRMPWSRLTAMLANTEAAWADYDGFHIGPPPPGPPPYSHLWAWTGPWLARARIDGDAAILGVLALTGEPGNAPPAIFRETVRYQRARATNWPTTENRAGPLPEAAAGREMAIYLIPGEHPVTFVSTIPYPPIENGPRP
jgi:hypothetical protein